MHGKSVTVGLVLQPRCLYKAEHRAGFAAATCKKLAVAVLAAGFLAAPGLHDMML